MSMFPVTDGVIAPWFATYGETITDPITWRHMRSMAERERASLADLLPAYQRAGFADIVDEVTAGLTRCDALLSAMETQMAAAGV